MDEDQWSDLEVFSIARTRRTDISITISKRKIITLNAGFVQHAKSQISNHTHGILSFSKKNNAIVFKFTSDADLLGAKKMSFRNKKVNVNNTENVSNATLSAKSFFDYYGIDINKYAGRYEPKLETIPFLGECWVIFLINRKLRG